MRLVSRKAAPWVGVLVGLAFAPAATAPIDDPEQALIDLKGVMVDEVVVRPPGPAWWSVSQGSRTVHILGVLLQYPADKTWDRTTTERRIDRAERIILPAAVKPAPTDPMAKLRRVDLPPALRRRVERAAASLGAPASRYLSENPVNAGLLLVTDMRSRLRLQGGLLQAEVVQMARAKNRRATYAAVIDREPYDLKLRSTTDANEIACLEAALEEVEAGIEPLRDAVAGWAEGDVRAALGAPRGLERCNFALPGQAAMSRRAISAQVSAVEASLKGRQTADTVTSAVAVVSLRALLAEDGVLDQLRDKGYQITSPRF